MKVLLIVCNFFCALREYLNPAREREREREKERKGRKCSNIITENTLKRTTRI